METKTVNHSYIAQGLWEATPYRAKATPAELIAALKRQERRYRGASDMDCIEAICRGELPVARVGPTTAVKNKITLGLRAQTWGARLLNAHTSDDTGILYYLSVGTDNTAPTESQTQLVREIFRAAPLTKAATSDNKQKFVLFLDFDDANPDVTTNLSSDGTKTQITVDSVTGFAAGDAIRVSTSPSASISRILSISGSTLNLDPTLPLAYIPLSGQAVDLCIGETGAHGNEDATSSANTGKMFARSGLAFYNSSDLAYFIKHTFSGVSA